VGIAARQHKETRGNQVMAKGGQGEGGTMAVVSRTAEVDGGLDSAW